MGRGIERREFLRSGTAAVLGLGAWGLPRTAWAALGETARMRRTRVLGRTGLRISDISFGSSRTTDAAVVRHAFDRGINYFDSAESYKGGQAERAIGEALEGHRDEVWLTSKTKCGADTRREQLMKALEGSLQRLRTDHIDIYFNHAVNDVERLRNDEWKEFTTRARQQGKIRFTGISGHAGRLIECLDYALDHDLADVILCAYNFGQDPAFYQRFVSRLDWIAVQSDLPRVLRKAHEKGIGVVAMKTLRGAKLNDMRPYEKGGATFAQAAFRWVLSNADVDALIVSMTSPEQIDEYLAASGAPPPQASEIDLLEQYLLAGRASHCEHGCDSCHDACPSGVQISEVLRTRMYALDYGDIAYAREDYARLGDGATACVSCHDRPCLGRCPGGLAVGQLTASTHRLLG